MTARISKQMPLGEVVKKFPSAVPVMLKYGLHCVGCHVAAFEAIEEGARAHGMSDEDIAKMIGEMNQAVEEEKR